jgi:ABC-2 type transport system ATP-binding protein
VLALLGPNGAGKTTTVRVLTTNVAPDEGRAEVMGFSTTRQPNQVRARIGLAGQYATVDGNLTGRENLRLIGRLTQLRRAAVRQREQELLEQFGLLDAADRPVRTYSGGMRRRLDVAAALMHRPRVLFLDEPTTGLDLESRLALWEMVRELVTGGTTVLLTTQYLEEADRLAQRIVVIGDGKVIAEGTPAELKARLGSAVVEIGFSQEAEAAKAEAVLSGHGGPAAQRDGTTVRLPADDGARVVMITMTTLDAHSLVPTNLALREPSLDDVFLALTGYSHRHSPAAPRAVAQPEEAR